MDIDVLIKEKNLPAVREIARTLGFKHEAIPMSFDNGRVKIFRLVKFAGAEAIPLDLLLVTPALRSVWKQRRKLATEHGRISVVSKKGLVLMKKRRSSGQYRDDIHLLNGGDKR